MNCPVNGCRWKMDYPFIEDTLEKELLRHLSIVARDAITPEDPHELELNRLKQNPQ